MNADGLKRRAVEKLRDGIHLGITPEDHGRFWKRILLINFTRLRYIFPFLFFLSVVLVLSDLYYKSIWDTISGYHHFYWLDAVFIGGVSLFFLLERLHHPDRAADVRPSHTALLCAFLSFVMIWCGVVGAVEEMVESAESTLVIGGFAVAVGAYLRGWLLLFIYFMGLAAFRIALGVLGLNDRPFLAGHLYLIGLVSLAWAISQVLYRGQLRNLVAEEALKKASDSLEKRVEERTRELTAANRRLEREMATRKEVMASLQESEAKFRALTETAASAIFIIQGEQFVYVNPATEAILEYPGGDLLTMKFWDVVHPEDRETVKNRGLARQRREPVPSQYEFRVVTRIGTTRWVDFSATFIEFRGGPAMLGTAFDITKLKLALEALGESEEKYRVLVENANDAVFIIQNGRIIFANPRTWESLDCRPEDLSRIPFQEFIHPEDREGVLAAYQQRLKGELDNTPYDLRIIAMDGREIYGQVSAVQIQWEGAPATLNFIRDITAQKRLEDQFHQAQRMEAIGVLAGGVAHDVNNLLMGIQGYVSLMLLNLAPDHPHCAKLKNIEASVESGAGLTRQLLGFARGGKYEVRTTDLNRLVREKTRMFGAARKELTIRESYAEGCLSVEADRHQMEQVLLNLYINAWQAMPDGGVLTVETENVRLDNGDAAEVGATPGPYVKLSVADTGVGMTAAVRERIFEPFYTTKERGRGTGLGLASTYGIVTNHGGVIRVFSEPGRGSRFEILLPAVAAPPAVEEFSCSDLLTGEGTILLVDDEQTIREIGEEMLRRLGYGVLTAAGGEEAVALYGEKGDGVDLVVLDMIMPRMGGSETFDRLKAMDPAVKVLLSSGYSLDGQAAELMARGCDGFIQKPFKMTALSQKIRDVLVSGGDRRRP